jgi:hypothetical protein
MQLDASNGRRRLVEGGAGITASAGGAKTTNELDLDPTQHCTSLPLTPQTSTPDPALTRKPDESTHTGTTPHNPHPIPR